MPTIETITVTIHGLAVGDDRRRPGCGRRGGRHEIVGRFDEAFELGQQLLGSLRGGWLEALRTGVGVERKLAL